MDMGMDMGMDTSMGMGTIKLVSKYSLTLGSCWWGNK